ncbi:polyprenyl synthetase family protein [Porticoccus sp.]|nr:polyprenyl synthetase family protein [Porticoccus sp.]
MLPFHEVVKSEFEEVNGIIVNRLNSEVDLVENIGQYIIDGGGKRMRPLLVILSAKVSGYKGSDHLHLAAIIEFIHTATLLHDDVVDTSDLRRGKATANTKFGNAPSVLVGDFLYSRAFQMLVGVGNLDVMQTIADTTNAISEGEVQQLANARNSNISEDVYKKVIFKKTAILFDTAAKIGAIIAESQTGHIESLSNYGRNIGMAFQLMDDVLDYNGDSENLGKNIGDDLAEGKMTLPLIYAMKNGKNSQKIVIQEAIKNTNICDLKNILTIIRETGALEYSMSCAKKYAMDAKQCLVDLPKSIEKIAMLELAEFSIDRKY